MRQITLTLNEIDLLYIRNCLFRERRELMKKDAERSLQGGRITFADKLRKGRIEDDARLCDILDGAYNTLDR